MNAKCYLCGTTETIHEMDNLCEDCLTKETEVWRDCDLHPDVECFATYSQATGEITYRDCEVTK